MSPKYAKDQPEGFVNRIEKVAIVGVSVFFETPQHGRASRANHVTPSQASGHIGGCLTKWLLQGGKHTITAISRKESKAQFPAGVQVKTYTPGDHASLVAALQGQEFLVITLPGGGVQTNGLEPALVRAAAEARVPYVMPNAFGPDPLNEPMMRQILIGNPFFEARAEIERCGVSSWVVLATGFWYEWSLVGDGAHRFGCDLARRRMTFFDDGGEKITTTTWDQCGRALAALLALPRLPRDAADAGPAVDDWAGRAVRVASFRVSQRDLLASAQRVTGTADADWAVEHVSSRERFARAQAKMRDPATRLEGFAEQMYTRVFFPTGEGDQARLGLANEALGLPEEDLDEATREGLRLGQTGVLSYGR